MTPSNMTPSVHPTSVHPDPTNPQVLWFRIQPPPALSPDDPQALHDALHEALRLHLRRLGIVSHQAAGFGVAIPIGRELLPADRHELANFVLDACDSVTVEIGDICLAQELIDDCKDRLRHPEPDDTARLAQVGAHMVMNVVRQALRQWRQAIQALQGAQDHQPAKAEPPRAAAPAEVPTEVPAEVPTNAVGTPTHPRQPAALQALCMAVQLMPEISRRNRGRYWARVRARLRQHGLVLAQRHGVAMVLAVGRPLGAHDRHLIVRVLLEQPQTWRVTFNEPFDVAWCLSEDFAVRVADDEDDCDGSHDSESPHEPGSDASYRAAHHAAQLAALRHALRQLLVRACIGHARTVEAAQQRLREATQR